jgi:hypothetical protein
MVASSHTRRTGSISIYDAGIILKSDGALRTLRPSAHVRFSLTCIIAQAMSAHVRRQISNRFRKVNYDTHTQTIRAATVRTSVHAPLL